MCEVSYHFKVTSQLQRPKKSFFFFCLTKLKSVILSSVYKKKILTISKSGRVILKNVFSNKVKKLRRCHSLVNGRASWGNFCGERSSLLFYIICIFLFTSRTLQNSYVEALHANSYGKFKSGKKSLGKENENNSSE